MKKGLLSILASALLVVGCQNYDDQFSALETQINALASTVAGLSQVQSDLSSLAGTVASLSSSVAGLGSQIDTAVADGLADITADVAAIQTAVADVASSEEVAALQTAVDDSQTDLDELLANSSVFNGSVTINSVSTLAAFKAMGSTLAIINGSVDIDVSADMSQADVQTVVDQMLTITGDFAYDAVTAVAETTFTNLSGVQSITVSQEGGYRFPALVSALNISLGTTFSSKIAVIDFGLLTSVTKFSSTADHQVHFNKATNFHITSLPRYGASLSVLLDEGSTFLMDALTDTNSAGVQSPLSLTIEGPAAMNISKLDGKGGTLSFKDVVSATVTDYDGTITLLAGVETFSSNNVVAITHSGADDIVSFTAKGVIDPNATTASPDTSGPIINLASKGDLEDVTLTGDFESITLNGNNNMTTATIGAKASDGIIDLTNNGDLVTLDTTGSSATGFTLTNNDNLTSAAIQTTMIAGTATTDVIDGVVIVTNNDDMTELEIWSSGLKTLTITGNSDLAKITGDKIVALGATAPTAAAPQTAVTISGNDLEASVAQVLTAATATNAGDSTGAFTTASNMGSLSAYLKLVAADVYSTAGVYYDTVQSTTSSVSVETGSTTTGQVAANAILITAPGSGGVTTGNNSAVKEQRAWQIPNVAGQQLGLEIDGVDVLHNGTTYGRVTTTGNSAIDLVALKSSLATSRATTLGTTLDVKFEGNPQMPSIVFRANVTSASGSNGEYYTNDQVAAIGAGTNLSLVTSYDSFTLTIDGLSVTASATAVATGAVSSTVAAASVASILGQTWNTKYGTAGSVSGDMSLWSANGDYVSGTISISLKSSNSGSRGFGKAVSIAWNRATTLQTSMATGSRGAAAVTSETGSVIDWTIGTTEATSDNSATGSALILYLTEVTNSVTQTSNNASVTGTNVNRAGAKAIDELATTNILYTPSGTGNATTTTANIYPTDARGDVVNGEGANEGTTSAVVARTLTNRSQWTFGS